MEKISKEEKTITLFTKSYGASNRTRWWQASCKWMVIIPTVGNYTVQEVLYDKSLHRFKSQVLNFSSINFPMVSQFESLFWERNGFAT